MTSDELRDRINTVLMQEAYAYSYNGRLRGGLGSFSVGISSPPRVTGVVPKQVDDKPNHDLVRSENAELLLKLYSSLSNKDKSEFMDILLNSIDQQSKFTDIAYLPYFVLYRIGEVSKPLGNLVERLPDYAHGNSNILGLLSHLLTHEFDNFRRTDLDAILVVTHGDPTADAFNIGHKVNEVKFKALADELDDVNPEINTDRDKLLSYWDKNLGSTTIPTLIREVEAYFSEGQFSKSKLATCLGRVRVLLIESMRELSTEFDDKKAIGARTKDPEVIEWYEKHKILDAEEIELINAIYGITSRRGTHAAISNREFARIAKNITYEFIVMMVGLAGESS